MSKIKVILKINDYLIEEKAIMKDSILLFKDNDKLKTNIKIDLNKNILTRENKEILIEMNFNDQKIKYYLKEINKEFSNDFKVLNIDKKEKNIKIIYQVEENKFNLSLEYKEEV